jgi:TIR domain
MADVFISYSRRDTELVRSLHARLARSERDAWVDWEDIPPSAEWMAEIERAIEAADTFVFVISPDSVVSLTCEDECAHAAACNKRIVPVVAREVDPQSAPERIRKLNWLFFRPTDDLEAAYNQLIEIIDTDLAWVRAHSRLLVRAKEWQANENDRSYLLGGTDLEDSERWVAQAFQRQPKPAELQLSYVAASRAEETRRQRNQLRGFYLVSLVYGILQSAISYVVVFDEISEEGLIALSPLWVLGIVFGGFGLTLGRNSIRRSVVATVVAGALLFVFFVTLWGSL